MENPLQLSSAISSAAGPEASDAVQGLVHLPDQLVFAVAAGADGGPADTFSVRVVGKALRLAFQPKDGVPPPTVLADRARLVRSAIHAASDAIRSQSAERRAGGATVVVLLFSPGDRKRALLMNVGDCRCYRFRNGRPERLTRALSVGEQEEESPLLLDVLNNTIGGNERAEIEEQGIAVDAGDAFALMPGLLFRDKADVMVGRALRRSCNEGLRAMAQTLVDEAAKTGTKGGTALVVGTETVRKQPEAVPPVPEAIVPAATPTLEPQPVPQPEPEPVTAPEPAQPVASVAAPVVAVEPVAPVAAPPVEEKVVEAAEPLPVQVPPEVTAPAPAPEPLPEVPPAEAKPAARATPARKTPRTPVKRVGDYEPVAPLATAPVAPKPSAPPAPAVPSAPAAPSVPRPVSPLARKPLLHTTSLSPEQGKKMTLPPILLPIALVAVAALIVVGLSYLGYRLWAGRSRSPDSELAAGAAAADAVEQAWRAGTWGSLEKRLPSLPPLPPDREVMVKAWVGLWQKAAAPDFTDLQARSHLDSLDALVRLAGGSAAGHPVQWSARDRADVYCRTVAEKQKRLAEAIQSLLDAVNRRGDIPFDDHATQQAVLQGMGQFSRGRIASRLDALRMDFAIVRTDEGQLTSWVNSGAALLPMDEIALQQKPGEPLRKMQASLDRAWENLFEAINGLSTDIAYWRKQRLSSELQTRINRLEAVRLNIVSDRRKYGDIQRWRVSSGNKQLVKWLLSETAAIGAQLPKTTPPPVSSTRRR